MKVKSADCRGARYIERSAVGSLIWWTNWRSVSFFLVSRWPACPSSCKAFQALKEMDLEHVQQLHSHRTSCRHLVCR